MKEIVITTQKEFDKLPNRFKEYTVIIIRGEERIIVNEARDNSSVVARDNSSVVARGNSSVEAWGQAIVRVFSDLVKIIMHGYSVLSIPVNININVKHDKTYIIQRYERQKYLEREGVKINRGNVILFKKVSSEYKTQEGTVNETKWPIGRIVTHPEWDPTKSECGEGKYHACSRPYFCDEFRNEQGDKYIAVRIKLNDLFEWENPIYTHKIAFREGKVLYECDRFGRKRHETKI